MPLRFVNAGDALKTYDDTVKSNEERAWLRSTRERALRDDAEKQAVDRALREGVRPQASALANVQAEPELVLSRHDDGTPLEQPIVVREATPARRPSWRAPVVQRLSSTPGGGRAAVELAGAEEKHQVDERRAASTESRENRELAYRGLEQFNKAMDLGDLDTARAVNSRFRLGIPEQAFANQRVFARLRGIATTLNRSGIRGETAAEVFKAALENPDAPIEQAIQRGMAAGAQRADRGDLIETSQGWYNLRTRQYEKGPGDQVLMPTERRLTHPPRAGAGGGAAKAPRVQSTKADSRGYLWLVMSDGTTKPFTDALGNHLKGDVAARRAASLIGKLISPIQTREERQAAVREGRAISDGLGEDQPRQPGVRRPLEAFQR